jgi:hypothetical protein
VQKEIAMNASIQLVGRAHQSRQKKKGVFAERTCQQASARSFELGVFQLQASFEF